MISGFVADTLFFVTPVVATVPQDSAGSALAVRAALAATDLLLAISGGAIVLATVARWFLHSRRDPLASVPLRGNQLREDSLILAVFVYLTSYLVASSLLGFLAGDVEAGPTFSAAGSIAQIGGAAICLWIAAKTFDGGVRRFCFGKGGGAGAKITWTLGGTVVALGLCPLVLEGTAILVRYILPEHEFKPHSVVEALRDETQPLDIMIALWLGAVVVAPIAEEFFFRGILQTYLVGLLHRVAGTEPAGDTPADTASNGGQPKPGGGCRWIALGLTSAAFGLAHFPQPHAIPALMLLAFIFGYAYERTGSLWLPVVMHAAFNFRTLIWDALGGATG